MTPRDEFVVESPLDPQFDVDAALYGTIVAYHGSPTDNIHSIIQNGLQSFSFSRRERNGAVFGAGIYFAESLRVAESFSQSKSIVSECAPCSLFLQPYVAWHLCVLSSSDRKDLAPL